MKRRLAALLALLFVTLLAGCSGAPFGLTPDFVEASPGDDGEYRVTFSVTNDGGERFHDVAVHGYALTGDRVCSASFGDVDGGTARETTTCESFPSLLVPDAREMSRSDFEDYDGWGYVEHDVVLYHGYNGSHQFEPFTRRHADARPDEVGRELPPNENVFRAAKCTQWAEGENLDAIGDRPWVEWERRPPNTSTSYGIEVENASDGSAERYVYSESVATAGMVRAVREAQRGERPAASIAVEETEFFDAVAALAGQRVSNRSEISDAKPSIEGSVREWDWTSIDCWTEPPQHSGINGHSVETFVRYDGTVWRLELSVKERYSGPARAGNGSDVDS